MKAEHRKELETNILADRMGRLVQRMKTRPQRRSIFYFIFGLVVVVASFVLYRLDIGSRLEDTKRWVMLEQGDREFLLEMSGFKQTKKGLTVVDKDLTTAGKAARFQVARFFVWDQGTRRLGGDTADALGSLKFAQDIYRSLEKECKDEPEWHAEALYGLAVIEENLAIQNTDRLQDAKKKYEEVVEKYKDSGFGTLAGRRVKELRDNEKSITDFYQDMRIKFNVPEEKANLPKVVP